MVLEPDLAIDAERVEKAFGATRAVDGASVRVGHGELVALLGPSGSGKTTLLRVIAGFERPDAGRVAIGGREVAGNGSWVEPEHRRIGMVFQDGALFPHLTVAGNVAFGGARPEFDEEGFDLGGLPVTYALTVPFLVAARGGKQRVTLPDSRTLDIDVPEGTADGTTLPTDARRSQYLVTLRPLRPTQRSVPDSI